MATTTTQDQARADDRLMREAHYALQQANPKAYHLIESELEYAQKKLGRERDEAIYALLYPRLGWLLARLLRWRPRHGW